MEKAGTTMSPGVSTSIPRTSISEVSVNSKMPEAEAVSVSEVSRVSESLEPRTETQIADQLTEVAKADGVDEALEKLSKGDFETGSNEAEGEGLAPQENAGDFEEIQDISEKEMPIETRVSQLEEKANSLIEQNQELKGRLENAEEINRLAVMSVYEMAQVLKQMVEGMEEDEKKKESMIEILIKLMAKLMQAMFVPEEGDGVVQGEDPKERKIVDLLSKSAPVEKMAA